MFDVFPDPDKEDLRPCTATLIHQLQCEPECGSFWESGLPRYCLSPTGNDKHIEHIESASPRRCGHLRKLYLPLVLSLREGAGQPALPDAGVGRGLSCWGRLKVSVQEPQSLRKLEISCIAAACAYRAKKPTLFVLLGLCKKKTPSGLAWQATSAQVASWQMNFVGRHQPQTSISGSMATAVGTVVACWLAF